MSKYGDFLRTQGASDADITLLDTPIAQRAFDAQQAAIAAETARLKEEADARVADYKSKADTWYNDVAQPNLTKAQSDATKANAEAARLRSLVAQSQDEGLRRVAEEMGIKIDGTSNPPAPTNKENIIDTSKFVTMDALKEMSNSVGDGLAALQDMVLEHSQLFPAQRLDVRKLRSEAVAANKNVYDYWQTKYNVAAAREAADKATREAYEKKLREEGAAEVRKQYAEASINPNLAPGQTSTNVFVPRPQSNREKAPWESGLDGTNGSNDRVAHAAKLFVEKQGAGRTN
jgi:hypothetical protein